MTGGTIPITVIAGYLGAGKTTLLNHLLRSTTSRRLVLAVDDFGPINVDAELVPRHGHLLLRLGDGCSCCTFAGALASTLLALRRRPEPPLRVVIEASGVADPRRIAQYGHLPGFRLDGIIVVADAETVRLRARDRVVGTRIVQQLRAADLLVLNKVDLATTGERSEAVRWLRALAPGAEVVETSHARLPALLVFGSHGAEDARLSRRAAPEGQADPDSPPDHAAAYARWSWSAVAPLKEAAFASWAAGLPRSVLRAKGLLRLAGDPVHRFLFQRVGPRWSVRRDAPWGPAEPGCRLTLIAPAGTLDADRLDRSIGLCTGRASA